MIIFGIKGGWTVSTRERGWFKKGVMKVNTPYVYKVYDPEKGGTHTVTKNKRTHVFYLKSGAICD